MENRKNTIIISMLVTIIIGLIIVFGIKLCELKNDKNHNNNIEKNATSTVTASATVEPTKVADDNEGAVNNSASALATDETASDESNKLETDDSTSDENFAATVSPSKETTLNPTVEPTKAPTVVPTVAPTKVPTVAPTKSPTKSPTKAPTRTPTSTPTRAATRTPDNGGNVDSSTPYGKHGKLKVSGTQLVDKNGNALQLKGASTHGIAWFGEYVNKEAFSTLRGWGANVVRIAMYTNEYNGYMSGGDKDELEKKVTDGVKYATDLGMYVIIDWHILSDGNPNTYKNDAKNFFDKMSKKYKNYGNVIYEICNEPNNVQWSDVKSYADEIIATIRSNDSDAIIIVGTPTWSQDVDVAIDNPVAQPKNVMYAVHFYAATHTQWLRDKVANAISKGAPVFISEFSICDASGNGAIDYTQADEWMKFINDNKLSCVMWSLCNKAETSALISSSCTKTSGWSVNDLSYTGKWWKNNCIS